MATLSEVMKDTADAIREKTGKSELIAPVDFAEEIKGITAGGGGGELEGEYFLAKPNGRYWKLNIIQENESGVINIPFDELTEEQKVGIVHLYLQLLGDRSIVYTCVGQKVRIGGMVPSRGIYYTTYGKIQSNLGYSASRMEHGTDRYDLYSCFAWQEAYPNLPPNIVDSLPDGVTITSVFDYVKFILELDMGSTMSDEEIYAMMSEMFMIEPITKEEYENFVSEAKKNEDY